MRTLFARTSRTGRALSYSTVCDNTAPVGADLANYGGTVTLDHSTVGDAYGL
jgi:hypothetical protein